ncbi:hypothetical protein BDA96_03G439500 [Sorghum bicolor]|uniref:Uncharacterized protein n=2 Tax=Sorghum bicolor TaxID=4558 RepID=A0A921RKZ8_SORBI|nr:uncharacterized protein LOC110433289 [Sorghum bicolor]KAG0540787.1 hypothetical protein BDA96_03G439500 [Sorghum bicolor]KXG34014.1 hypothetical protein SORBI_3003G407400 [Sorghum bicolor]|eukprot:XP_021310761.1 uncharacterized protein LOC110433289 [Sorghum bicolor]
MRSRQGNGGQGVPASRSSATVSTERKRATPVKKKDEITEDGGGPEERPTGARFDTIGNIMETRRHCYHGRCGRGEARPRSPPLSWRGVSPSSQWCEWGSPCREAHWV